MFSPQAITDCCSHGLSESKDALGRWAVLQGPRCADVKAPRRKGAYPSGGCRRSRNCTDDLRGLRKRQTPHSRRAAWPGCRAIGHGRVVPARASGEAPPQCSRKASKIRPLPYCPCASSGNPPPNPLRAHLGKSVWEKLFKTQGTCLLSRPPTASAASTKWPLHRRIRAGDRHIPICSRESVRTD
jgi:hypothetical protein